MQTMTKKPAAGADPHASGVHVAERPVQPCPLPFHSHSPSYASPTAVKAPRAIESAPAQRIDYLPLVDSIRILEEMLKTQQDLVREYIYDGNRRKFHGGVYELSEKVLHIENIHPKAEGLLNVLYDGLSGLKTSLDIEFEGG